MSSLTRRLVLGATLVLSRPSIGQPIRQRPSPAQLRIRSKAATTAGRT
jgi:hypothetical protein